MKGSHQDNNHVHTSTPLWVQCSLLLNAVALAALLYTRIPKFSSPVQQSSSPQPVFHECHAPFPPFLSSEPPSGAEIPLQKAFDKLDSALQCEFERGSFDSLSVAIVGSEGSLYEGFWGRLRANESDDGQATTVNRHSIYRIASISKLFTALETFILRDRGILNLDDSISSVCPEFRYNTYYAPITFRALMTHMSGIGCDLPPGDARNHWPKSLYGAGPPPFNGLEFPSKQQVFDGVANTRPIMAPYTYPVYSNTGYSLLGIANVAANKAAVGPSALSTHAELVKVDIFDPLGLNGSSFLVTEDNKRNVVVASIDPSQIDQDFKDAMNPSGGQMSSLSDLVKLMQVLINPQRPESILSSFTLREWMRPMHSWFDDYSEVGALWEIYSSADSYGRKQKLYQKIGELPGYHTAFTLNPVNSYGIIVLQTGPTSDTIRLTKLVTNYVQAAFDLLLEDAARKNLQGTWRSADASLTLTVEIDRGSSYVSEYTINGTDVLQVVQQDGPVPSARLPLWSTAENEYRIVVPVDEGCLYPWVTLDWYGYVDGVSTNVIVAETDSRGERVLYLPALNATLHNEKLVFDGDDAGSV